MALVDSAALLANHVDDLLRQHRDGITPTFDDIENLRAYAELVQADVRFVRMTAAAGEAPRQAPAAAVTVERMPAGVREVLHRVRIELVASLQESMAGRA